MKNYKVYQIYKYIDYVVEVCESYEDKNVIDFWLYKRDIGIKQYMLGAYRKDINNLEELIGNNIEMWVEIFEEKLRNE